MAIWVPRVVMVRTIVDRAGVTTCRHRHNYVQAGFVQSGRVTVRLDDKRRFDAGPDDFFCIAQRQDHIIENLPDQDTAAIDLRFQAVLGERVARKLSLQTENGLNEMARYSFKIARPYARALRRPLEEMIAVTQSQSGETRNFLLGMQLVSLAGLIRDLPRDTQSLLKEEPQAHRAVTQAIKIIRDHYPHPIDLTFLAERTAVSVGHLTRLFHRFTGYSPKQYLLRHRIDQAKRLILAHETMPLKEVAHRTGFSDLQQFSRAFRRVEGCSPSNYFE